MAWRGRKSEIGGPSAQVVSDLLADQTTGRHPLKAVSPEWGPLLPSWRPCRPACPPCASRQPCLQGPGHSIGLQPQPVPWVRRRNSCGVIAVPVAVILHKIVKQCIRQPLLQCTCGPASHPALTQQVVPHVTSRGLLQPGSYLALHTGQQHHHPLLVCAILRLRQAAFQPQIAQQMPAGQQTSKNSVFLKR